MTQTRVLVGVLRSDKACSPVSPPMWRVQGEIRTWYICLAGHIVDVMSFNTLELLTGA